MTEQPPKRNRVIEPPTIITDTREQDNLFSRGRRERGAEWTCDVTGARCVSDCLSEGDYSVRGVSACWCAVERESLQDFIGSLIQGQARFMAELERLKNYRYPLIIVEGNFQELRTGEYRSAAAPQSITGLMCRVLQDYRIPIHLSDSHVGAREFCLQFLMRANRMYHDAMHGAKHRYA